jgi:hypothetical protein
VLVSICIPSLKVIALSVAVFGVVWPGKISFAHYDSGVPAVAEVPAPRLGVERLLGSD